MFEEHLGLIFFLWIVGASTLFAMLISTQVDRMNHLSFRESSTAQN
jgi:hypothetical protein